MKKGIDMALRATGKRNSRLRAAALAFAERLSRSGSGAQAWIGRSTARELGKKRG